MYFYRKLQTLEAKLLYMKLTKFILLNDLIYLRLGVYSLKPQID